MEQFKKMKMRINNPDHSKAVQEWLFDQGYKWAGDSNIQHTDKDFLFTGTWNPKGVSYSTNDTNTFQDSKATEVNLQHLDPHLYHRSVSPCNPAIKSYHAKDAPKSEIEKLSTQLKQLDKAIDSHENKQNKRKKDRERVIQKMESMLPEGYGIYLTGESEIEVADIPWDKHVIEGSDWECVGEVEGFTEGDYYQVDKFNEGGYPEMLDDEGKLVWFWSFHNFKRVA